MQVCVGLLLLLSACDELSASRSDVKAQCLRDTDCTLVPAELTCCSDCAPMPPFQAAPVWVVDGMYIETEDHCLTTHTTCVQSTCASPPPGCSGRAICSEGRCAAVSSGCAIPQS